MKVSVIIPVYNTEKYVRDSIDSVLNQSLKDLEVICIDDHSPDQCGAILDEYQKKDSRVKVIHLSENHRQGYGRNRGMEMATGEYLYFLDSDDLIEKTALEELYDQAVREDLDVIFFDSQVIYEKEELKKVYSPAFLVRKGTYEDKVYDGKQLMDQFIQEGGWTCYPQRIFWKRKLIEEEGICYLEEIEHEDEYFAMAGILVAKRCRCIQKPYFILRVRENSVMTTKPAPKNFHGYLMNFYYMNRFLAERNIDTLGSRANVGRMYERATTFYKYMKDEYDLSEWFIKEIDKSIYRCFIASLNMASYYQSLLSEELIRKLQKSKGIYIYGAGIVGRRIADALAIHEDILIKGFMVTSMEGNPAVLKNRQVLSIDQADMKEGELVLVAVAASHLSEIAEILDERKIRWVYYKGNGNE